MVLNLDRSRLVAVAITAWNHFIGQWRWFASVVSLWPYKLKNIYNAITMLWCDWNLIPSFKHLLLGDNVWYSDDSAYFNHWTCMHMLDKFWRLNAALWKGSWFYFKNFCYHLLVVYLPLFVISRMELSLSMPNSFKLNFLFFLFQIWSLGYI